MFIITKTFTDDEGHLYTKVNPKQYSTPEEAYDAMREDNLYDIDYDLDDGDRIMVDDSFYDDVLDAFEEYDIEYEEV